MIRLRNELIDRNRNHHLIENEADVNSRIDAMRISRVEARQVQINEVEEDEAEDGTPESDA